MRVTDEHIRLKCGIDALQYIVFQKHLIVYTVIIFCLSIGIVLPVKKKKKNGENSTTHARNKLAVNQVIVIFMK